MTNVKKNSNQTGEDLNHKRSPFLAYTGKLSDEQYNDFLDLWYALSLSKHCILSREDEVVHIYTIRINLEFVIASFKDGLLNHNEWSKFFTKVCDDSQSS
jgi:hypothetical protein